MEHPMWMYCMYDVFLLKYVYDNEPILWSQYHRMNLSDYRVLLSSQGPEFNVN